MNEIIIGIVSDFRFEQEDENFVNTRYAVGENVIKAFAEKATVLILPHERSGASNYINMIDGLVFINSSLQIDPFYYAESKKGEYTTDNRRADFEFDMLRKAVDKKIPVLGFGEGMQIINVFFGGSLYQNIIEEIPGVINHQQQDKNIDLSHPYHDNVILPNTELAKILGTDVLQVNSSHSQAIKKLGSGLKINAISKVDNIIEGIESEESSSWVVGLQWLPEYVYAKESNENQREKMLFDAFLEKAKNMKKG